MMHDAHTKNASIITTPRSLNCPSLQIPFIVVFYWPKEMQSGAIDSNKLTLQQYIQTYNIRKKMEERKRSKSKGKEVTFQMKHEQNMQGTFGMIDGYITQTKAELEDVILNTDLDKDKIFFLIAKRIDAMIYKLKEEISKMYKDVYLHYIVEHDNQMFKANVDTVSYFKEKIASSEEEKKRSNLAQVVKDNFKKQQKTGYLVNLIFDKTNIETSQMKDEKKHETTGVEMSPSKVERAVLQIETPKKRQESKTPQIELRQQKKIKSEKNIKRSVKPSEMLQVNPEKKQNKKLSPLTNNTDQNKNSIEKPNSKQKLQINSNNHDQKRPNSFIDMIFQMGTHNEIGQKSKISKPKQISNVPMQSYMKSDRHINELPISPRSNGLTPRKQSMGQANMKPNPSKNQFKSPKARIFKREEYIRK